MEGRRRGGGGGGGGCNRVGPVTRWSGAPWSRVTAVMAEPLAPSRQGELYCNVPCPQRGGRQEGGRLSNTMLADVWLFKPPFKFSGATCPFINNWAGTPAWPHGTGQRGPVLKRTPAPVLLVTYLFITRNSSGAKWWSWAHRSTQETAPCERREPIKQSTNSPLFQSTKPSLFLLQVYFCTFYFQTPKSVSPSLSLSLSLSLPFGDLFAACLEAVARKVYRGAELKSELNYVLLVRTDYQKRTEQQQQQQQKKK